VAKTRRRREPAVSLSQRPTDLRKRFQQRRTHYRFTRLHAAVKRHDSHEASKLLANRTVPGGETVYENSISSDSLTQRGNTVGSVSDAHFAFMNRLGSILTETIWHTPEGTDANGLSCVNAVDHTRILETKLARTAEMLPLHSHITSFQPPWNTSPPSLASSIEQLFQDMTFSILGEPGFLALQSVPMTVESPTAGGDSLELTASPDFHFLVGCYTVLSTGSSYSNKLSTVVRVTWSEKLDVWIAPEDRR
jgi:hypothetical protein